MKRILIDIYKTNNLNSGLGQFSNNYANEIIKTAPENFNINFLSPKNNTLSTKIAKKCVPVSFQKRHLPFLNPVYDLWHSLHQFPSHLPKKSTKQLLTIHDLNFMTEKDSAKASKYLKRLQKNVDRADALTVISKYTKSQVLEHVDIKDKPIHTIYNGVHLQKFEDTIQPEFVKNDKFFFSIGIISAKKNFHVLVPIMQHFKDYHLIIAGNNNSDYAGEIEETANKLGLQNQVHLCGMISEQDKYWLYTHCEAFLFPSMAEGFGLPVIEAMLVGKPVFLSKYTCLPEIGGEHAFYWDSFETEHMVDVLKTNLRQFYMNREKASFEMIRYAEKFSWEISIKQYIDLYKELSL
ncbi:MAG: glycosyltransferase family 4 protein [Bacteroidales bacterium]|nr:glycosyltransferase family 4 protein [Bacteroidales bacterium]